MDKKTMRKLQEISQRVSYDMKKHGIKKESVGAEIYDRLASARNNATTNKQREQLSKVLDSEAVQGMKYRKTEEINHDYGKELDRRMTKEIDRAVKKGDLKLDSSGYDQFMRKNHNK